MSDGKLKTLIIGASFYGAALLKTLGDDAILIERGYRIGEEFSSALRVNRFCGNVKTQLGRAFLDGMKKHRLIDAGGAIYSAPAAYLLADMSLGANMLFATEILSIKKENGAYKVELFNCEGRQTVVADRIIDTTAEGAVRAGIQAKKRLNVILSAPTPETEYDSFTKGNILAFAAELSEPYQSVRKRLYEQLDGVVLAADIFDYEIEQTAYKKDDNYYIIPSVGFKNPISAVDAGGQGYEF